MAKLKLYEYPHPVLKQKAVKVETVDDELRLFLDDMLETMYEEDGVGLAAPQVGVSKRIVVIDVHNGEEGERVPLFLINPEIIEHSQETMLNEEGCLSVPDQRAEVERYMSVKVRYVDYHGKEQEIIGEGLLAICLQHELDHLNGVLYIDRLSRLKRQMLVKKLNKYYKQRQEA